MFCSCIGILWKGGDAGLNYISMSEAAKKGGLIDRAVMKYCSEGMMQGDF